MISTRAAGSRAGDDSDNDSLPPLIDVSDDTGNASDADSPPPLVDADHSDGPAGSDEDDDDKNDDGPELEPWCTCGECYVGENHEYTDEYSDEEDDEDYTDEDEDDEHDHECLCDHHYEQVTGRQRNGSSSNSNGNSASASSSNRPSASASTAGSSSLSAPATSDPSFPSTPMKLGVKFLRPQGSEEVFELTLPGNVTITALRAAVAEKAMIEPGLARLIFRGRVLQDGKAAHEYGLEDNTTLHLVTKPPLERTGAGNSNGNAPNLLNSRMTTLATTRSWTSSSNGTSDGATNSNTANNTSSSRPTANGSTTQSRTNRTAANGRPSRVPATTTQFATMPGGGVTAQVTMAINEDDVDREFTPERFFDRLMSVMQGGVPHDMSRGSGGARRSGGTSSNSRRSGTARSRGGTGSSSNARSSQASSSRTGTGASASSATQNQRGTGSSSPPPAPHVRYTPLLAWPAAHYRAHLKRHLDPVPQTHLFREFRAAADAGTLDAILDRALGTARHGTPATTTPTSPPVRTRATSTSAFAPTPGVPTLAAARDLLRAMARLETVAATAPGFLDHAHVSHPAAIRHDFAALIDAEVDAAQFDDALAHVPAASVWRHVQDLLAQHETLTARVGKLAREWQAANGTSVADAQRRAVVAGFVAAATARAYEAAARVLAGATVQPVVGVENVVMVLPGDVDAAELVGKRGGSQASGLLAGAAASLAAGAPGATVLSARRR
ncbi:hypothetical protein GGF31_002332 [Allomyces arbusculus]|nr:hypothetical protein GGF31_002332 [Allomyces arbusculus]